MALTGMGMGVGVFLVPMADGGELLSGAGNKQEPGSLNKQEPGQAFPKGGD